MSLHPHVLIFDSGVGGLSIAREVIAAHPRCRLTYASDNAQFPYGSKSTEELIDRVEQVIGELISIAQPDIIVIACNTASTVTLPYLRSRFAIPFVGVVPAIKPAAQVSRTRTIGILATPATVERPYTRQLIRDYAADCQVVLHGSSDLVLQAEEKLAGRELDQVCILRELECLTHNPLAAQMDTIVLACTHFPLLLTELEQLALPVAYQWIDSGEAIARRVGYWIAQLPSSDQHYPGPYRVIFTAPSPYWSLLQNNLRQYLGNGLGVELTILDVKLAGKVSLKS